MRFFIIISSLCLGLTFGSPIGQVEVTTTVPELRDETFQDATTVIVEVFADEAATSVAVTQRARQAGVDEEEESNEEAEATTISSKSRPEPSIPQPFANISNFAAEFQYSSQFALGPSGSETVPAANKPVVQSGEASVAAQPVVAQGVPQPASIVIPIEPAGVVGGGDETESEEQAAADVPVTAVPEVPSVQVVQVVERVEESEKDNEIANDDITTIKSVLS